MCLQAPESMRFFTKGGVNGEEIAEEGSGRREGLTALGLVRWPAGPQHLEFVICGFSRDLDLRASGAGAGTLLLEKQSTDPARPPSP